MDSTDAIYCILTFASNFSSILKEIFNRLVKTQITYGLRLLLAFIESCNSGIRDKKKFEKNNKFLLISIDQLFS